MPSRPAGGEMKSTLLLVLAVAVWFDVKERRIPNSLIAVGLLAGLTASVISGQWAGLGRSLAGIALGVLLFFPFFVCRMIGAGDAKLFGVVGAFVGWEALLPIWAYTLIAGGVLGLISVALAGSFRQLLLDIKLLVISAAYRVEAVAVSLDHPSGKASIRLPYAVAIAAGVLVWMVGSS